MLVYIDKQTGRAKIQGGMRVNPYKMRVRDDIRADFIILKAVYFNNEIHWLFF